MIINDKNVYRFYMIIFIVNTGLKHFIDIKIQFIALYRLFFCQTFCLLMW